MSLPTRLTRSEGGPYRQWLLAALWLMVVCLFALAVFNWQQENARRSLRQEAILKQSGDDIGSRLVRLERTMQLLAPEGDPAAVSADQRNRLLLAANGSQGDLVWLAWLDPSGNLALGWPPGVGQQMSNDDLLSAATRRRPFLSLRLAPMPGAQPSDPAQILITRIVRLPDGRVNGLQVAGFSLDFLSRTDVRLEGQELGDIMLLAEDGAPLLQSKKSGDAGFFARLLTYQRGLPSGSSMWIEDKEGLSGGRRVLLHQLADYPLTLVLLPAAVWSMDIPFAVAVPVLGVLLILLLLLWLRRGGRAQGDSEQLLLTQFTVDHNDDMVFWVDADGRFRYVNESATRHLGYSREQLLQMSVPQIDPAFGLAIYLQFFQRLRKERSITIESTLRSSSGEIFPVEIVANYMNPSGREFNCAIVRNISARQADQARLQQTSQQLMLALQAMRAGLWEWQPGSNQVSWDEQHCRLYGLAVSSRMLTLEQWLAMVAVGDRERLRAELQTALLRRQELNLECELDLPSGEARFLRICGKLENSDTDAPRCLVGLSIDITAARQAEKLVRTISRVSDRVQGEGFFRSFIEELGRFLRCRCLLLAELVPAGEGEPASLRTLAVSEGQQLQDNYCLPLINTAAADVLARGLGIYPERVQVLFPADPLLSRLQAQSYVGLSLQGAHGGGLGVLLCIHDKPMRDVQGVHSLLSIFATRLGAELERAHIDAAMTAQRAYLDHLLLHAPVIICRIDAAGKIVDINQAVQAVTGHLAQDLIGEPWAAIFGPRGQQAHNRGLLLNPQRRVLSNLELVTLSRNGQPRTLMWNATQRLDDNGQLLDVVAVGVDVSARISAESEVRALNAQLEQRVTERTEQLQQAIHELESFSYSVSHDLRAPLRSISGFCGMLIEDHAAQLDAQGQDFLLRIGRSAERMGVLIDDLLGLSHVSRQNLRRCECDLALLVRHAWSELSAAQPQRQIELACEEPLPANADPGLLQIVFDNLLRNAWKFTARKAAAHVQVGRMEQDGVQVYFVRDDGAGFDMAYSARLFGAFQRLHDAADFEGTGIGLAIVQRIIHRHGGRIWAEGVVDEGACFYFTLPDSSTAQ